MATTYLAFFIIFNLIFSAVNGAVDVKFLQEIAPQIIQLVYDEQNGLLQERQVMSTVCEHMAPPPLDVPTLRHHAFLPPSAQSLENSRLARVVERATAELAARTGANVDDVQQFARQINVQPTVLGQKCPENFQNDQINCTNVNVRSIDGRCTNLRHPLWGAAGTAFSRLLPANYEDGIAAPRITSKATPGVALPLARHISTCMSPMFIKSHRTITNAFTFFGQIIDHDLGLAPMARVDDPRTGGKKPPQCCGVAPECKHAECFELTLPENDPRYAPVGRKCMEFVRTVPALRESCRLGYREQVNEPTHWLDASFLYGSTNESQQLLRAFVDGLMATSQSSEAINNQLELAPSRKDDFECNSPTPEKHCFVGGDPRINENPILTALHQIYIREHNRIARALKSRAIDHNNNGGTPLRSTTDEDLYQTARKIVIAQVQHSVFNEFLPVLLGSTIMGDTKNELELCAHGKKRSNAAAAYCRDDDAYYTGFDERMPPHVSHEFSTAAFRMGHTLLPEFFFRTFLDESFNVEQRLGEHFFDHSQVFERGAVAGLLYGAMIKNAEVYDTTIVRSVRDDLFQERKSNKNIGMDLYSLNLQRSRDHGMQFYNDYRELCGLNRAQNFEDLRDVMESENIDRLKRAYANVNDIELFPGGLSEMPVNNNDGIVGPTFACIIAQQFHQSKKSDRFWYENPGQFSPVQLRELRKFKVAKMFCDNTVEIQRTQPFVMLQPTPMLNAERPCSELDSVNLDVMVSLLPSIS